MKVVSLVRSNRNRKVGFLRTENRINILLSRAKHVMYLIGNAETYLNVDMWAEVHAQPTQTGAVGDAMPLFYPRHPDTPILCSEPDEFVRKSPEGGCDLPCTERLEPCGHRCRARYHSQALHEAFLWPRKCPRIRATCEHACLKLSRDECGPCLVGISDVGLPCGHKTTTECRETLHLDQVICTVEVEKVVPGCGHVVRVECYRDVTSDSFSCRTACGKDLSCSHKCPGQCGTCKKEGHAKCSKVCDRPYGACNHRCPRTCHPGEDYGACEKSCEV